MTKLRFVIFIRSFKNKKALSGHYNASQTSLKPIPIVF